MEDESSLELCLGLSCGGSSSKFKVKDTSDPKGEVSASRVMGSNITVPDDSFKHLFKSALENQESKGKQKSDPVTQPQENFFTDLAKCSAPIVHGPNDARTHITRHQELLLGNSTIESKEEKVGSNKRRFPFEELNCQNKLENLIDYVDIHRSKKTAGAVSNTSEDGSTGENDHVVESGENAPQLWLPSQREEDGKCSDALKFNVKSGLNESSGVGFKGPKEPSLLGKETNTEYEKPTFGVPLSLQPLKTMNKPCSVPGTIPSSIGSNATDFSSVMKLVPIENGEPIAVSTENTRSMQLAFGYTSSQLPMLETVSSWAFNSEPLHLSSFSSRDQFGGVQNHEYFEDGAKTTQAACNTFTTLSYDGKSSDLAIASSKCVLETGGTSAQPEEGKSRNYTPKANKPSNNPVTEGFPREGSAIRPGIALNLRFGGCGSYPDLPWVSATGPGPNGKTISGVTYKYNENQIKIVCACHGTHMSPDEFVQHANAEPMNSENNPNLISFPPSNKANSAQS